MRFRFGYAFGLCVLSGCLAPATTSGKTGAAGNDAGSTKVPPVADKCGASAGHAAIHRLNNAEYDNSVRDLLFSKLTPAAAFPADPTGANGYSNDSDARDSFDELITDYYTAAQALSAELLATKGAASGAYATIAPCAATMTAATQSACAAQVVTTLGARAFRRPLTATEQTALTATFASSVDFDTGLGDFVVALLLDPGFVFVSYESTDTAQSTDPSAQYALDDYQLAARLSYFLWQSMPDDALIQLAAAGTLHGNGVLTAQVARMLRDDRVTGMLRTLRDEFVGLGVISSGSVQGLDDSLRLSMIQETDLFLKDLVQSNKGVMTMLTSPTSFVNKALADQYGVAFTGSDPTQFVEVTLPPTQRMGILTQASVLTATAGSTAATDPVKRGLWVTTHIMCAQPPAPPPNIAQLPASLPPNATVKQLLAAHSASAACSGCHATMDPVGLSLENYDPFGAWRTTYANGQPVDASGQLPDGAKFADALDLFRTFPAEASVQGCITRSLVGYALARAVVSEDDACVADALGTYAARPGATFTDLVAGIVTSNFFRMQQGEAP